MSKIADHIEESNTNLFMLILVILLVTSFQAGRYIQELDDEARMYTAAQVSAIVLQQREGIRNERQ